MIGSRSKPRRLYNPERAWISPEYPAMKWDTILVGVKQCPISHAGAEQLAWWSDLTCVSSNIIFEAPSSSRGFYTHLNGTRQSSSGGIRCLTVVDFRPCLLALDCPTCLCEQ